MNRLQRPLRRRVGPKLVDDEVENVFVSVTVVAQINGIEGCPTSMDSIATAPHCRQRCTQGFF